MSNYNAFALIFLAPIAIIIAAVFTLAIGGLVGYGVFWIYTSLLGFTLGFSAIDAAAIGSIVAIFAGSSAA